jgi:competence ComEA-like helix-hairpin-helix protein
LRRALPFPIIALVKSFWQHHTNALRSTFRNARFPRHPSPHPRAVFPGVRQKETSRPPININTANSSDLQQVPGIGPSIAQKILDTRKSYGAFKSVDDLLTIEALAPKNSTKCANI